MLLLSLKEIIFLFIALPQYVLCQTVSNSSLSQEPRERPCADASLILPCVCVVNTDSRMEMDCSSVSSEAELAQVFQVNLPFKNFYSLTISDNSNLRELRNGVFGEANFEIFYINYNYVLNIIEAGVFSESYTTARDIEMNYNQITYFPFHDLVSFQNLFGLNLGSNSISIFTSFASASLSFLNLANNYLTELPPTMFTASPNLAIIYLNGNQLQDIPSGMFSELVFLQYLSLSWNQLTHLLPQSLELRTLLSCTVHLEDNNIATVAVNAISGLNSGELDLSRNEITELTDEVYRQLLEDDVNIRIDENPLLCGCEIAWIMLNPTYLAHIYYGAQCSDLEYMHDLDPLPFESC